MKSIKTNLIREIQSNPNLGNYALLVRSIKGKKFSKLSIQKAFKTYLKNGDYDRSCKRKLLDDLYKISNLA